MSEELPVRNEKHGKGTKTIASGIARSYTDGRMLRVDRGRTQYQDGHVRLWYEFADLSLEQASQAAGVHIRSWILTIPESGTPKIAQVRAHNRKFKRAPKKSEVNEDASSIQLAGLLAHLQNSSLLHADATKDFLKKREESAAEALDNSHHIGGFALRHLFGR